MDTQDGLVQLEEQVHLDIAVGQDYQVTQDGLGCLVILVGRDCRVIQDGQV